MEGWLSPEEVEKYVLDNQKLVHYLIKKLDVAPSDYDDIVQIGMMGLTKAAQTFNRSKNIKFSTYASRCINNEILMYYRKENKRAGDRSLDEPINPDSDGEEISLGSTIASPGSLFVEEIENREIFLLTMNIILNLLNSRQRLIILYRMSGDKQETIAKKLDLSRSYVSRVESQTKEKIKAYLKKKEEFVETFKFEIVKSSYRLSFISKTIELAMTLQNLVFTQHWECNIHYDGEHIEIQVPRTPEYFWYIPELIKKIENYEIEYP